MADASARKLTEDVVEKPGEAWVAETPLRAGAVGLTGAVMQNVTHIAPAIAAFFFTATIVNFAGGHAPLAYLLGFLVVLALGMCLVQLAKKFPSAGGYFTYVSRTVGPRAGFLTGWMFVLYSPIVTGPIVAFLGFILEGELQSNYGWTWFHWWMFVVVVLPVLAALAYLGIQLSVRTIVVVHRVWGALWWLALLAMFTSVIGASLACQNVATRMWYRMGRAGVLPTAFGNVDSKRQTPTVAIHAQTALNVLLGLGAAAIFGPDKIFVFTVGFVLVLGVIFVYVMANIGVVLYYWRENRREFNPIYHVMFPVGTSLVLLYSVCASFNPLPAPPYNFTPLVVGVWLVLGIAVLVVLRRRGNETWLTKPAEIVEERREGAQA